MDPCPERVVLDRGAPSGHEPFRPPGEVASTVAGGDGDHLTCAK
ncbi:hypothetical protein ACIBLB_38725 [Streptosporangium canum]